MKQIAKTTNSDPTSVYAMAYSIKDRGRGILVINKTPVKLMATFSKDVLISGEATCVEIQRGHDEPGFRPPISKHVTSSKIDIGGFGVCVITRIAL